MDQRDEIKARLSIVDLVSEYVELKKAGRNFKGLCPFHSEKSPSFVVSPDKELAHCFGCHKGGDIFGFYQEVEGVDFVQALRDLGEKVGVKIQEVDKVEVAKSKDKKGKIFELHEIAAKIFESNLYSEEGEKVLAYVRKRGVSEELIKQYRIGFSLDSFDSLYKEFLKQGFEKADIVESGLASGKDLSLSKIFDRFRLRLMFPIFSKEGKVIAFGGRALKADEQAKYLNSPETPIYHKSDVLFGFNFAKDEIRKTETVILVEGYFDQIAMYQAGLKNVVAVSGTALTPRHLQLLKKTAKNILFCLDSDSAGREALYRSAELALLEGFNLKVIDLGGAKDPGEFLQNNPAGLTQAVESAIDFFDYFLKLEFFSLSDSERRDMAVLQNFIEKVLPLLHRIQSSIMKDVVIRKLAQAVAVDFKVIYTELAKLDVKKNVIVKSELSSVKPEAKKYSYEEHFWAYLFCLPEVFKFLASKLEKLEFLVTEKSVYKIFMDYYNNGRDLSEIRLPDLDLDDELKRKYSVVAVYLESVYVDEWTLESVQTELNKILIRWFETYKSTEKPKLEMQLKEAERGNDKEKRNELLKKTIMLDSISIH